MNHFKIARYLLLYILGILSLISCKEEIPFQFSNEPGVISGRIIDYDTVFKSGILFYFDAISRLPKREVFDIDPDGTFKVEFTLPHPIYNISDIDLQGKYYALFLEPGKEYSIEVTNNTFKLDEGPDSTNNKINYITFYLLTRLDQEINECLFLYTKGLSINEYISKQKDLAAKKKQIIDSLARNSALNDFVLNIAYESANYEVAWAWINYRFDYSDLNMIKVRDSLPGNFYSDLLKEYPINNYQAISTRTYIDYISNLRHVLSTNESKGTLIQFIESSGKYSNGQIELIKGFYERDTVVTNSQQFKDFYSEKNKKELSDLRRRYYVGTLLESVKELPKGIGRDLVISQGISEYYFKTAFIRPTAGEWNSIEKLVSNKFIIDYLRNLENDCILTTASDIVENKISNNLDDIGSPMANKIFDKYKGKVIYADFWSTWCAPCRMEIPNSKTLMKDYSDKDIAFVFLCCKSNKQDWKNTLNHEKLEGDHYYIEESDYLVLSEIFQVNGFPTYVLLDKDGNVVDYNAPRPSSIEIRSELDKLLEK